MAHGADLRTQDRQRPRHRHARSTTATPASTFPRRRGRFINPPGRGAEAPGGLPRRRAGQGHLRRGRPGRQDAADQQLALHRHRRDAEKTQSSTYGGPDATHAVIPHYDLQGACSDATASTSLVFQVTEGRARWRRRSSTSTRSSGRELGFDPDGRPRVSGLWDTVKSQKMQAQDHDRHPDLPRHHRRADADHRRRRRGQHHVRGGEGAHPRDRRQDGARRPPGWITWPFVLEGLVYTFIGGARRHRDRHRSS